jgi:hypothetical protein
MSNINVEIKKVNGIDVLTVSIALSAGPSSSGKTTVIASTRGNHISGAMYEGKPVVVGLNAYVK